MKRVAHGLPIARHGINDRRLGSTPGCCSGFITDGEHGAVDASGDPGVRTAAGESGFRLTGAVLGLAVKSTPVSMAFGAYGASMSIYSNFLSRGKDVVLPKDTPMEIGAKRQQRRLPSLRPSKAPALRTAFGNRVASYSK